jgi:uncharacterized membrane-anchored protein
MEDSTAQHSGTQLPGIELLQRGLDWFSRRKQFVLTTGLIFQLTVLVVMIVKPATTLVSGDTVLLRIVPVDPRDLFRGDYVILNYEFSRVPPSGIPGLVTRDQPGQTVFVTLEPEGDGRHWRAGPFSLKPPASGKFLRGQIGSHSQIEFGIESFFVQEGTGLEYEEAAGRRQLSAEVAVDDSGHAVLKRLVIE